MTVIPFPPRLELSSAAPPAIATDALADLVFSEILSREAELLALAEAEAEAASAISYGRFARGAGWWSGSGRVAGGRRGRRDESGIQKSPCPGLAKCVVRPGRGQKSQSLEWEETKPE